MGKKSIKYLDQKLTEDSTLSSMMLIVPLADGTARFDCKMCKRSYRHHPSLFRHFRSAHKKQYERCLALRNRIRSERAAAKLLGIPYPRRKNCKRQSRTLKKNQAPPPPPPLPNLEIQPNDILGPDSGMEPIGHDVPCLDNSQPLSAEEASAMIFTCKICSQEFGSEQGFSTHLLDCKDKQYIINDLEQYLMNTTEINMDLPTSFTAPQVFPCTPCKFNFSNEMALNEHIKTQHVDVSMNLVVNPINNFQAVSSILCAQCNKLFEDQNVFNQHICLGNIVLHISN